jgi:DeoR/GlpR family transcriptional regulator of sugar metabolism
VIVVADSSKWGVVGLADIAPLTAAHVVVTDDRLPRAAARILSERVPQLIETRDEAA